MWLAEDKVQNRLAKALNRYEKQEKVRNKRFFFREWLRKNIRAVSVGSWARLLLNQTQNQILLCLEFNKFNKQSVCYINLFKKI